MYFTLFLGRDKLYTKKFVIIFEIVKHSITFVIRNYSYMAARKEQLKPTEKELEILQVLWDKGPASVRDVHDALGGETENGYTTILKLMQIMHEKGIVTRQKSGKLHLYKASHEHSQENTRQQIVSKMIDTVFKGSAMQLVMSALGNKQSSSEELKEIRKYLDELEEGEI